MNITINDNNKGVEAYMTTNKENYDAIPQSIKDKLGKYNVVVLYDNKQKRYTAALPTNKELMRYCCSDNYRVITCLHPADFITELDTRQSNIKKGLLTPDYTSLDTADSAYMVGYELLRLKILQLAGKRV